MVIPMMMRMMMATWLTKMLLYHDLGFLARLHHCHRSPPPFTIKSSSLSSSLSSLLSSSLSSLLSSSLSSCCLLFHIFLLSFTFRLAMSLLRLETCNRNNFCYNLNIWLFLADKYSGLGILEVMGSHEKHVDVYFSDWLGHRGHPPIKSRDLVPVRTEGA